MLRLFSKGFVTLSFLLASTSAFCYNLNTFKLQTIDNKDSVNYDLGGAIVTNNIIEIPFYIKTDDQIFAFDFEMTFNTEKLEYLSIIDHTGYIQYNVFQNPNDKKLRFTSNHTSPYNTSLKIISVRFKLTALCINESDFFKINNLLNGDPCSLKMAPKVLCGTSSTDNSHAIFNSIPNPINSDISLLIPSNSYLAMYNINGIAVFEHVNKLAIESTVMLPTDNLTNGIYTICYRSKNKVLSKKIIVQNN